MTNETTGQAVADWADVYNGLHYNGLRQIDASVAATIRLKHADGFGRLEAEWDALKRDDVAGYQRVLDMVWDWSHVRDSGPESIRKMASAIRAEWAKGLDLRDRVVEIATGQKAIVIEIDTIDVDESTGAPTRALVEWSDRTRTWALVEDFRKATI